MWRYARSTFHDKRADPAWGRRWPGELARQFTQPLAVLLAAAAMLAWVSGSPRLAIAIVACCPFIVWGADEIRRMIMRRRPAA